jgi:tetratricopeptide (TPR) repeat protein
VAQAKHSSVITLTLNPAGLRWVLILPALLALTGAWFAIRWYVGNTIAEYTSTPDADGIEMARLATRWSPADALTHWRLAFLQEKNFSAENLTAAVREYQLAVQVEPYDFRYWLELGRALEAAGDNEHGEKALRRAVELAPAYSYPRWQYGNLLLRQGRVDEAFAELSRAAEADPQMEAPVFGLAAQIFGGDIDKIGRALPSASLQLHFALSLISSGKPDQALQLVNTVSASDRKSESESVNDLIKAFMQGHHYRAALSLLRDEQPDASQLPAPEKIWNGGFELPLAYHDERPFHWMINSSSQAQVAADNVRPHGGRNSLRVIFKSSNKLESIPISQTVIVEPDAQYQLQFYQRTEGLVTASVPVLLVNDSLGKPLASSPPLAAGTSDWHPVTLNFKTRPGEEGVLITFYRNPCIDKDPICPIFGNIWYDDFNLQRISGPGPAAANARSSSR